MKKLILSILATVGIAVILPVSAFAASGTTIIDGHIYKSGNPVAGANVTVVCDGNTQTSGPTTSNGYYAVEFNNNNAANTCLAGDTANVSAVQGSASGSKSGVVGNVGGTDINLAIVDVSVVPELGALTGAGAAILGGAAFMVVRRKQLNQN